MPVIAAATLTNFAVELLSAGGADAEEAAIVADSLVQANLRGHDSHGVMRIPFYIQNVKNGRLPPTGATRGAAPCVLAMMIDAICCAAAISAYSPKRPMCAD